MEPDNRFQLNKYEPDTTMRDYIVSIWNGRKIIVALTAIAMIIALFKAFTSPILYQSTSKLIAKTGDGGKNSNLANIAALAGVDLGKSNTMDPSIYLNYQIKDSEFLKQILSKKWYYNGDSLLLAQIWDQKPDKTVKNADHAFQTTLIDRLRNDDCINLSREKGTGIMSLSTQFKDPKLAFQVNEYIIMMLDEYVINSLKSQVKEKRIFIEKRIAEIHSDLQISENALARFREKNTISTAPKLLLQEQRLLRNVMVNQELYLQLKKQYEVARIEEKNDQPLIEVIMKPEIPLDHVSPRKKYIMAIGLFLGLGLGVLGVFIRDWIKLNFGTISAGYRDQDTTEEKDLKAKVSSA